jgi:hypothetical protein
VSFWQEKRQKWYIAHYRNLKKSYLGHSTVDILPALSRMYSYVFSFVSVVLVHNVAALLLEYIVEDQCALIISLGTENAVVW